MLDRRRAVTVVVAMALAVSAVALAGTRGLYKLGVQTHVGQTADETHQVRFEMKMTKRLEGFVEIRERLRATDGSPARLIEQIFEGMPFTWLHQSDIRFGCQCSQLRVMTTLSLLDRSEIQDLADEGEPLSIGCDYCGASYTVEVAQLQGLLSAS